MTYKIETTAKIIELDDYRPHSVTDCYCKCGKHWISTHPTGAKFLECPSCGEFIKVLE